MIKISNIISSRSKGYVTTYLLVIIGGLFLSLVFAASQTTLNVNTYAKLSLKYQSVAQLASSCVELALLDLYNRQASIQETTYVSEVGDCTYSVSQLSNSEYQITGQARDASQEIFYPFLRTVEIGEFIKIVM